MPGGSARVCASSRVGRRRRRPDRGRRAASITRARGTRPSSGCCTRNCSSSRPQGARQHVLGIAPRRRGCPRRRRRRRASTRATARGFGPRRPRRRRPPRAAPPPRRRRGRLDPTFARASCATIRSTRVPDPAPDPRRAALLRRAFSLSGVLAARRVPGAARRAQRARPHGRGRVRALVARVRRASPGSPSSRSAFVFAPLLFHAAFGLWLVVRRVPLATPSPYPPAAPRRHARDGRRSSSPSSRCTCPSCASAARSAHPGGAELLAVARRRPLVDVARPAVARRRLPARHRRVCFHFAAGLWGVFARTRRAARSPGRAASPRAGRVAVGVTMWLLFVDVVVLHATGTRLFGGAAQDDASSEPCPAPSSSAAP